MLILCPLKKQVRPHRSTQSWYTQSCTVFPCHKQEDLIEKSHRETLFHAPLENHCKIQEKWTMFLDITELRCWILGNLCKPMQQQEIFVGNPISPKFSLLFEKFSRKSHKTTTHSLFNDKLIGLSWTPPMWVQQTYNHITVQLTPKGLFGQNCPQRPRPKFFLAISELRGKGPFSYLYFRMF